MEITKELLQEIREAIEALMKHHYTWKERNEAYTLGKKVIKKMEEIQ